MIEDFITQMKVGKKRVTPARKKIYEILYSSRSPIQADKLVEKIGVNKTTIYRDLDLFMKIGLIKDVDFGDGVKRYELKDSGHHHHLICIHCKNVSDILVDEKFKIPDNFKVIKHNLEFFGYCQDCTQ